MSEEIYAKDMVEGVRYKFNTSLHTVVLKNGVYHYTTIMGEKFIGCPSEYSTVRLA